MMRGGEEMMRGEGGGEMEEMRRRVEGEGRGKGGGARK